MDEKIHITRMIFRDYATRGNVDAELKYGFTINIERQESAFCDKLYEMELEYDNIKFLQLIYELFRANNQDSIFDDLIAYEQGLFIDDKWLKWEDIKDMLDPVRG